MVEFRASALAGLRAQFAAHNGSENGRSESNLAKDDSLPYERESLLVQGKFYLYTPFYF